MTRTTSHGIKKLAKESAVIAVGQFLCIAGTLFGIRLLTGAMSPANYGEFTLAMTIVMLANKVTYGPIEGSATRYLMAAIETNEIIPFVNVLKRKMLNASIFISLIAIIAIIIFALTEYKYSLLLILSTTIYIIISGYSSIINGIQKAARQRGRVTLHTSFDIWAKYLAATGFLIYFGGKSFAALFGFALSSFGVTISQYRLFRKDFITHNKNNIWPTEIANKWKKYISFYAWPLILWGLFAWAQVASDRWSLTIFTTMDQVGLYAVLYQLGFGSITMISGFIITLVQPILFQIVGDASDKKRILRVYNITKLVMFSFLIFTLFAFIISFIFHTLIFSWFVSYQFKNVSWLLPWIVLPAGLMATCQHATSYFLCEGNTKALLVPKIVIFSLGIILNIVGAYFSGIVGVVVANIIMNAIHLIWMTALLASKRKSLGNI